MASNISLPFASYNMHGFRNGAGMLNELCRTHKVIAVQEHWLREDELNKFSLVHNDFNFHGASGMMSAAASGLIRGRPFGGTCFLWYCNGGRANKIGEGNWEKFAFVRTRLCG